MKPDLMVPVLSHGFRHGTPEGGLAIRVTGGSQ
jgi:hypothetical protein